MRGRSGGDARHSIQKKRHRTYTTSDKEGPLHVCSAKRNPK